MTGRGPPGWAIERGAASDHLELGIQGYNVFNRYDLRGSGGPADLSVSPAVIGTGPALGRTWTASVRYNF